MKTTRKVLLSPGFGAGWSTWADDEYQEFALFDPALIQAVENGVDLGNEDDIETPLGDFAMRLRQKFGADTYFYFGGAEQLRVVEVHGKFQVEEYDGSESLRFKESDDWI